MPPTIDLLQIKIENAKKQLSDDTLNAIATVAWQAEIIKMRETKGYTFEQLGDLELETELLLCGLINPKDYSGELEKRMGISKASANELVEEMNKLVFSKIKEELIKSMERKKIFEKSNSPLEEYPDLKSGGGGLSTPSRERATPQEGNHHDTEAEKKSNMQILSNAGIEIINGSGDEKKETLPIPDLPAVPSAQQMQAGKLELSTPAKATPQEGNNTIHPMLSQKMSGSFQMPIVKTEHTLENITKTNTPVPVDLKPKIPKVDPYREIPE
jgi:hypothetical protein